MISIYCLFLLFIPVSYTHLFPDAGENPDARSATEYKPEQTWNYEIGTRLNPVSYTHLYITIFAW